MKALTLTLTCIIALTVPVMVSAENVAATEEATAVELVEKAVSYWQDKGKDYTLKLINASAGPLKQGTLYTFSGDFSGMVLAHPAQTSLRGKNVWTLKDAKGKYLTQEMVKIAQSQDGCGWVEYEWDRVNEPGASTKRTYIKRIPDQDAYVACGYYVKQ